MCEELRRVELPRGPLGRGEEVPSGAREGSHGKYLSEEYVVEGRGGAQLAREVSEAVARAVQAES